MEGFEEDQGGYDDYGGGTLGYDSHAAGYDEELSISNAEEETNSTANSEDKSEAASDSQNATCLFFSVYFSSSFLSTDDFLLSTSYHSSSPTIYIAKVGLMKTTLRDLFRQLDSQIWKMKKMVVMPRTILILNRK